MKKTNLNPLLTVQLLAVIHDKMGHICGTAEVEVPLAVMRFERETPKAKFLERYLTVESPTMASLLDLHDGETLGYVLGVEECKRYAKCFMNHVEKMEKQEDK